MELSEASEELVAQLRILGNSYGPMGVALVAAKLTDMGALVDHLRAEEYNRAQNGWGNDAILEDSPRTLVRDVQRAINFHSAENGSNTPDFILAEYLTGCLAAFDKAVQERHRHHTGEL